MDVLSSLRAARLVPVVVLDDAADADGLAGALVDGGLPVAEVTFRTAAAQDSIRAMSARGDMLVGAGTVLTPAQVDQAVAAGASYVVSPGLSRAVVERCAEHGVLALPGAVTATEIQAALELGLTPRRPRRANPRLRPPPPPRPAAPRRSRRSPRRSPASRSCRPAASARRTCRTT